ncbi:DUF6989 domain-containing protein [Polycyclovorans algicola]|uniref:DUF6989 domain-containing protein n=1 Tax=Polycyclovorans algicola TaxID=616992 RepID=UPI0004A74211|nr:hypothetical protein [Polycyclovorans algicola]
MNRSVREVLLFHGGFGLLAAAVVAATPAAQFGRWVLVLAIAYNLLLPLYAVFRGEPGWIDRWLFMLGVSALQVLPDWVLVSVTQTLHFHDHGIYRIGDAVPVYFMGLWVMVLFPVTLIADHSRSARYLAAALLGGLAFTAAEWLAVPLQLWSPRNVDTFAGFALYPIPAEMALCVAALWLYRKTAHDGLLERIWAVGLAPVCYTGALMLSLLYFS